jgi:polyisoprenoid-binding protein YceI
MQNAGQDYTSINRKGVNKMTATLAPVIEAGSTPTTWQLDAAHSNVEFAVKHLMISTVKGRFADLTGTLKGDFLDPSSFELDVAIDVASIDTRQAQRDAHLKSPDFFDADKWPTISFAGKRIEGDVENEFVLVGDITIRDVTRELSLAVTNEGSVRDPWGNERIGFSARGKVDRRDFGLTWNQALETGGFVVGDEIRISIETEFTRE